MGCEFNFHRLKAAIDSEAIKAGKELIERAAYEHGHGGYTGSFAECDGVQLVPTPPTVTDATTAEEWLDENAEKWGPMLVIKVGEKYYAGANCSS